MHAGSTVDTMLAVDGPTRARPRKNVVMARTVQTTESDTSATQAVASMWRSSSPVATVNVPTDRNAPVATIAASAKGSVSATIVSATRM